MMNKVFRLIVFAALILNCIIPIISYKPVYAATVTLTVNGAYTKTGCVTKNPSYIGGAVDYTNLNSDDGDTSYLNDNASGYAGYGDIWSRVVYPFSTFSSSHLEINSVTLYIKARCTTWATYYFAGMGYFGSVLIGSTYYDDTTYILPQTKSDTNYYTGSKTWSVNPATGLKWTSADINSAKFGYKEFMAWDGYITYMCLVVDYAPPTVPSVTTQAATNTIYSGAAHYSLLNGTLVSHSGNTTDYVGFVYGTTSVATNPGNVAPAASGYSTNSTIYTSSLAAYSSNITGMIAGTTYYFRAFAHNGIGFAYGDQYSFTTLTNPTVSLLAATNIASSAARINSQVTFDGNTTCNITFGLDLITHAADFSAYTTKVNVSGTYTTGQFPYYDLSSLNASSTYYYNVRIQNSYGTAYGTERTFTTTSGVNEPINVIAMPSSNQISVLWTKNGSSSTLVRYSTGTYPTTTAQGTQAYFGTGASCLITGLSEGTTYYISLWGYTGGLYSAAYATTIATTLAYSSPTSAAIPTTVNPTGWMQTPDASGFATLPFYPIMQLNSTAYDFPLNTLWIVCWLIASAVAGMIIYNRGNNNLTMAVVGSLVMLFVGMVGGILGFEIIAIIAGLVIMIIVIAGRY